MTFRIIAFCCLMLIAALSAPGLHAAECVRFSSPEVRAKEVMENGRYELVFDGMVVAVTRTGDVGYRATFDVDRVWKGAVPKRFDLYVWELSPEVPRFEAGHLYLALARKLLTGPERDGAGVPSADGVAFTPVACSEPSLDLDLARYLGAGLPPKRLGREP
jgi:hypothetical protein